MAATIELKRDLPGRTREILAALPGVIVRSGRASTTLWVDGRSWDLALVRGGPHPYAVATPVLAAPTREALVFVVAERLPVRVRKELEEAGFAYADGTGAAHIELPGFYLHIEGRPSRSQTAVRTPAGIGVVAVRTIQSLLAEPAREWSVSDIAKAAACSTGEAHRVLTRLQLEGLVTAHGRARSLRRSVPRPGDLLDWLSTVPSARRIRERMYAFVYESDPAKLATTISARGLRENLDLAFSGASAAHLFGALVTTAVPTTMLRVSPSVDLADACSRLEAEPVDSGPNIVLVRDLGLLGTHRRQFKGPVPLAPPVRVWLDMLDEPRGEDAADLFREAVIGW
jgi:hypothetical protein